MYAWAFRHLPGPLWVRILSAVFLLTGIVFVLMEFVFPWVSQLIPVENPTFQP